MYCRTSWRAAVIGAAIVLSAHEQSRAAGAPELLTLESAIARSLAAAPDLRASASRLSAAQAGRLQAGVRPNPTVSVELENFAGTGSLGFVDGTELTATYSQLIERGGKRDARIGLAQRDVTLAEMERAVLRLDLIQKVEQAWFDALAAEAAIAPAEARLQLARSLSQEVERRVTAARDPLFARSRAQAELADAQIALQQARNARDNSVAALTALWGSAQPVTLPAASFYATGGDAGASTGPSPDEARDAARVSRAEAAIALERSKATLDPTVHGGVRYLKQADAAAFVAGVSMPLPLYDSNQGNVARALAERQAAELDAEATRLARLRQIADLQRRLSAARTEAASIREEVVPVAERAVTEVTEGFQRGGFTFRDVEDASEALVAARVRLIETLRTYHNTKAELDRATARFAAPLPQELP